MKLWRNWHQQLRSSHLSQGSAVSWIGTGGDPGAHNNWGQLSVTAYAFICGVTTNSKFIPEVCQATVQDYEDEAFNPPVTPEAGQLYQTSTGKDGAQEWKHIAIKKPA